jgi:hypothetical protein
MGGGGVGQVTTAPVSEPDILPGFKLAIPHLTAPLSIHTLPQLHLQHRALVAYCAVTASSYPPCGSFPLTSTPYVRVSRSLTAPSLTCLGAYRRDQLA